jgi:2,5-diketo-D-gluconate reductase A
MAIRSKTVEARTRALADGNQIPVLGLGVWQVPNGPIAVDAVRWALELGYTRSVGVSNFGLRELDQVLAAAPMAPAVDQLQLSPFEYRRRLLDGAHQRNTDIEAYSPLGTGRHLTNQAVERVAASIGRTPAQVLVRWCLQRNLVVIAKSTHRKRIEENAQIFDFTLSDQDMAALDALDRTNGTDRALERTWW